MEQDIQEPSSGHRGDLLRAGTGAADQGACVVCVLEEGRSRKAGRPSPSELPEWSEALTKARTLQAAAQHEGGPVMLVACHVRRSDLGHYGRMDHLAPASAMQEFEDYVAAMNQEEAEQAFAPLFRAAAEEPALPVQLRVVPEKKHLPALLEALSAESKVFLFYS